MRTWPATAHKSWQTLPKQAKTVADCRTAAVRNACIYRPARQQWPLAPQWCKQQARTTTVARAFVCCSTDAEQALQPGNRAATPFSPYPPA
jgi:hypothetical protein